MARDEAKITFSAETKDFQSQIKAAQNEMKNLKSEMKLNEAQFRNSGDTAEYYNNKISILEKELEANKQKQEALNSEIEVATKLFGEDSDEVKNLETSLNYAKIQEENLKYAIDSATDAANQQNGAVQETSNNLQTLTDIQVADFLGNMSDKALDAMQSMYALSEASGDYLDTISKQSQKMSMTTKDYQEWDYILSQNGASISSLKMGMKTLGNSLDDIQQKGSTTGTAFERLGISFEDLKDKTQVEVFEMVIKSLQGMEDQTKRNAIANDMFGKSGMELIPLLNNTNTSIEEYKNKANQLGLVLDDSAINKGVEFHDTLDTLKRSIDQVSNAVGSALMPVIEGVGATIEPIVPVITDVVNTMGEAIEKSPVLQSLLAGVTTAFIALSVALGVIGLIKAVTVAFGFLNAVMAANPIALVVIALAGFVGALTYSWKNSETFRNTVTGAFNATVSGIKSAWTPVEKYIVNPIQKAVKAVGDAIKKLKSFFKGLDLSLPKIKIPHIIIKGGKLPYGIGGMGKKPEIDVKWYRVAMRKPMVLNTATVFGSSTDGTLLGGGEAGPELIGGVGAVVNMFSNAVSRTLNSGIIDYYVMAQYITRAFIEANIGFTISGRELARLEAKNYGY